VVILFISFSGLAQINKGAVLAGGQFSFTSGNQAYNGQDHKSSTANIDISLGKAIRENQVFGVSLGYSPIRQHNVVDYLGVTDVRSDRYTVGVFYRMYAKLAKDFYFFGQTDVDYYSAMGTTHYQNANADVKGKANGAVLSVTPGLAYRVWKKLYLEMSLPSLLAIRYDVNDVKSPIPQVLSNTQKSFSAYSNLSGSTGLSSLGVGFRFVL
jgi:hypothetical protein